MKLCLGCANLYFQSGEMGYSEMTPPIDFAMRCQKGHWCFEFARTTQAEFAENLARAERCRNYKEISR